MPCKVSRRTLCFACCRSSPKWPRLAIANYCFNYELPGSRPRFYHNRFATCLPVEQGLTSIECGVLEALVIEELQKRNITSGIPPPLNQRMPVASELNHVG